MKAPFATLHSAGAVLMRAQEDEALREWYEERAAIREYEGGYARAEAERLAAEEAEASFEAWRRLPELDYHT